MAFSPMGFLLPILFDSCKKLKNILLVVFLVSLSNETQTVYPNFNQFKLYDKNNDDITNEMFKILLH